MEFHHLTRNLKIGLVILQVIDLVFSQGQRPIITKGPYSSEFQRGSAAKLECNADGYPKPIVSWYKDNSPVDLGGPKLTILEDNSLFFKRIRRRTDEGVYWCVARNAYGKDRSGNATITVTYLSRRFRLEPKSKDASLLHFVELQCTPPGGSPLPVIIWKKNNKDVIGDRRIKTQDGFGSIRYLRISKALQQDTGNYTCVAKNKVGERISGSAFLRVLVPPSITIVRRTVKVYETEMAALSCQVDGVPYPIVKWYKANDELPLSTRLHFTNQVQNKLSKIEIKNVQISDAGVYTCRASNSEGFAEKNVTLIARIFPKFLTRPGNMKVGIGQTAVFKWKISTEPGPRLIWQKTNGAHTELLSKNQLTNNRIVFGKNHQTFKIVNVQKDDEAAYILTVISETKSISATARLTVVDSVSALPEVTVFPLNQTVVQGNNFTVSCIAKGSPKPKVYWESASNNVKITKATEGVIITSDGFKHTLLLKGVRASDSGSYRCIATNPDRSVSKVAYLTVKPIRKHALPPDYVDYINITATSLVLRWKASRDPPGAPVTSYIVSYFDSTGHVWKAIASSVKQLQYKVRNLKPGTTYEFRVTAVNVIGAGLPSRSSQIKTKSSIFAISQKPTVTAVKTTKPVDKLLDIILNLEIQSRDEIDQYKISWTLVNPNNRVDGYELFWRRSSDEDFKRLKAIHDPKQNTYIWKNLEAGTQYEVKVRAFNTRYSSAFSNIKEFSTRTKQDYSILPPTNVKINVNATGKVLVMWQRSHIRGLTGYQIVWISLDGTSVETKTVPSSMTSYLITGLDPEKKYSVTLALVVHNVPGLKSQKLQIKPKLVESNKKNEANKIKKGTNGNGEETGTEKQAKNKNGGSQETLNAKKKSGIVELVQKPWFIGAVGGFLWVTLCVIVIVIVLRKRQKKRRKEPDFHTEQTNGLLPTNRTPVNSINRSRTSYRDSAFLWGEPETAAGSGLGLASSKSGNKPINGTIGGEKLDMRPLIAGKGGESIELKVKPLNGEFQRLFNDANNLRKPGESASISSSTRETFLNNLKNDKKAERYAASPKVSQNRDIENNQEKPRLKIQTAFEIQQGSAEADLAAEDIKEKNNMLERHAEIVRTSNKKFESDLVNCMENNTQATWKREKMKEAPEILTSGEDTLRRKAKNSFKPLPKLEVLNWADYPSPSKADSVVDSPPSSPKTAASGFSDINGSRATSRASQGSMTSLNKYPYANRSGQAPSVSSRRMSQSSSMMSSELYQSEMEPSIYSDVVSDRKKPKNKPLPPIDLDGLTSDILLQWAESVTNSSPSSSGSSSPSRLSAISSDGSFLTDEDFAQAVAAVVECGGFMDFDYSLSNMPGLQAPPSRPVPTDRQQRKKLEKIDAMIASKGKSNRSGPGSSMSHHRARHDTCSPPSVAPISFSSYLSNNPKRTTGASSLSSVPLTNNKYRQRAVNSNAGGDATGLRFANAENETPASFGTPPLTMSNLRQHDTSLGRTKKETKPLTVSNLRQHDTSLERHKKPNALPKVDPHGDVSHGDAFDGTMKDALANGNIAKPLSTMSALERNESLGSTKDSKSSINSEFEGRGTSERRKEKKYVVNLKDPTSSTGTSTASTVRTSQDQTEC